MTDGRLLAVFMLEYVNPFSCECVRRHSSLGEQSSEQFERQGSLASPATVEPVGLAIIRALSFVRGKLGRTDDGHKADNELLATQ
jgi:hypothetical protein